MLSKFITFSLLLVFATSCLKTEDVPDYSAADKKIIEDYLTAHNDTTAQSTASGLYYIIQKPGAGTKPKINSTVTVNYKGYLTDGTVFDASATGEPFTYPLNKLIAGWQQGIPLISPGGKIKLFIPSALGYGPYPTGKIPANSVLIFDIELIKFN